MSLIKLSAKSSKTRLATVLASLLVFGLSACGSGDGGGGDQDDPCVSLRIAGGEQCQERPLAVAALVSNLGYCTGTFITPRDVLTAAHCVPNAGSELVVATRGFSARAVRTRIHPRFVPNSLSPYDVAVVTIGQDAPVNPAPVLLSRDVVNGEQAVAYGYGLDENGDDLADRVEQGGYSLKATFLEVQDVNDQFIRTISNGEGDTCRGDSGGPILVENNDGDYGLVAVVSFGPNICEPDIGYPSGNTNLQSGVVRDFIAAVVPGASFN